MSISEIVMGIFKPAMDGLDSLFTSDEERLEAKNKMFALQSNLTQAFMQHEQKTIDSQRSIIMAEVQSDSWLTKNWRPLTMLFLVGCIGAHWLGYTPENLSAKAVEGLMEIVKIGLGGYVVGRSAEKVAKEWKNGKE